MAYETITVEQRDAVTLITLNRPNALNALNSTILAELSEAFAAYEAERLEATSKVVLINRVAPPDIIIKEVVERTGDRPFENIDDVISRDELTSFQQQYKEVAGYDLATLQAKANS